MQSVFAFLRQYVAYYATAVLGGFAGLWYESQGLFSLGTLGYAAGVVAMPAIIKALRGGESFADRWSRINQLIDQFQDGTLNPTIDLAQIKGTELAAELDKMIDEKVNAKLAEIADTKPAARSTRKKAVAK